MANTRPRRAFRQLLAGGTVLVLVASATFVLGRALISNFASAIAEITATITTTTPPFDPQSAIDDLPYPAAAVAIAGAVEAQLVLDRVTGRATHIIGSTPDPSSNDIDIRYQDRGGSTLTLIARGITVGKPRTSSMTVILTTSGQTFSAQPGDCALIVHRFEYVRDRRSQRLAPTFAGELQCAIAELRSNAIATFVAAFDL